MPRQRRTGKWPKMRRMLIITRSEVKSVDVRTRKEASLVGEYWSAGVQRYVTTGDQSGLRKFRGKSVASHPLETDPEVIKRLAKIGDLDFDDIYDLTA